MILKSDCHEYKVTPKEKCCINFTKSLAKLSKCKHGKVGAILISEDFLQIYSMGINGGPAMQQDCCCGDADAKYGCAHAEQNCLVKNADSTTSKVMICTKACCPTCATLIVNSKARVREFWYIEDYKDDMGLQILRRHGISVRKITS